ncbi:putative GPI-anchored protein pfl2 isoform X1 [Vespula squamosa]|uniref:GPI-anchored protein pfl2 isoform X1 n=1 Tax=Vespula squamosa TaxID=30214 RepID=A0ABD2C4W0_VESSQ
MRGFFGVPDVERRYKRKISKKRPCFSKIPRDSCEFSKLSCYSTGLDSRGEIVHEQPIVVDLTNDDTKLTRKKRETSASSSEHYAMIADSSNRFHRDNNSNNGIATALRDRGSCVIPVQPNHCLPIHPVPPVSTRAAPIPKSRKSRSPVLKLVRASILDAVNVESAKSTTLETNDDPEKEKSATSFPERSRKQKTSLEETNLVLQTNRNSCSIKIVDRLKRKITDEKSKERGKDATKDSKKRRKSLDVNSDGGYNELFTNSTANIDKERKTELCNDKKCAMSIVGSTTEINFEKEKIVPPLRLKKVVQEGKDGDRGNAEVPSNRDKEANYRIVTGATPRPESQSIPTICEYWTRENFDNDDNFDVALASSTTHDIVRRSSVKSDDYKLKYRRNRLKQKLKELQDKALDLSQEIANAPNIINSSPQRNTRLRQMMNCYEKQIENVSKLLNKLYNENPLANKFIDIDENKKEHQWDDEFVQNLSPISSPEPPKLSPRSPIDQYKSPDSVRSSPPVLPKVSLNISSSLDILDEHDAETVQLPNESTWIRCKNNMVEISSMADTFCEDITNQEWESNNNTDAGHQLTTPSILSSTSIDPCPSENVENIENGEVFFNNIGEVVEKDKVKMMHAKKEMMKELSKTIEVVSTNHSIIKETTEIRKHEVQDANRAIQINHIKSPIINSVTGGFEVPHNGRCDQVDATLPTPPITKTQMSSSIDMMNILQLGSNYYDSTLLKKNALETNKMEDSKKIQKVPSSTIQSRKTNYDSIASTFNQVEYPFTDQHFPIQSSNDNRIITEQFPTLGNWVAKMSKKQISKQKSKLQTVGNSISTIPMEEPTRTAKFDTHKVSVNETNTTSGNNVTVNITPQWNTERWHRQQHHQQRQQQQFASATPLSFPSTTTLSSGICTPLSTTQFHPSNYNINPYNGATFGYHSALYPVYNGYTYSRLHPGTPLTSYHIPMQDPLNSPLRPLSHVDKHLQNSSLQNSNRNFTSDILKYSGSLPTARFQSPNDFGFDRLRTTSTNNQNGEANCLSSLLLASSSLSPGTQQTLPRTPLSGYPTSNNQYGHNRIIPDVVAAAAAAAVVAAASIGRQRASLPSYSKSASTSINAVMEVDPTRLTSNTSNNRTREHLLSNQGQSIDVGTKEPQWNAAGYHSIPNLLLERLPFVRTEHDFPTTSTLSNNIQDSPSISTVSLPQMSKKVSRSIERSCETPNLGKVNRSPDTLSNIKCSNCGIAGSMFKCLGCEVAFYCNERCQARHWSIHVEKCPKKMPKLKKVA